MTWHDRGVPFRLVAFSGVDQHRSRGPKVPTAPGRMEGPVVGERAEGHNLTHGRPGAHWIREGDSLF
jgi:hypothetical protein